MRTNHLLQFCFILLICTSALSQQADPPQTALQINSLLNLTNIQSGYTYYSVNFELKPDQAKLFLITVETQQSQTIEIFTSIFYDGIKEYYKYPSYENNTNSCSYSSIDTCAVALPDVKQGETLNVTVYIGVEVFFTDQMSILATLEDVYDFKIGINYDIDFTLWESAVFTLEADQVNQYQQLVVQMQYDVFKDMGKFAMYAGVNEIPSGYKNRIKSKYMGAFTQILILEPLEDNQTYYIVLEGEQGSEFDVVVKPFSTSSPRLTMNDTVYYYSVGTGQKDHDDITFSMAINYAAEDQVMPLLVDLNALGGYGEFRIDYCDGLTNFTFENINGESGEVIIPVEQRKQCYDIIATNDGLMIENLIVSIRNVPWYFSFSIGVFEGLYPLIIGPYSEKMGVLIDSEKSRIYDIEGYINASFVLKFKTISGEENLNFTIQECKVRLLGGEKCKVILDSNINAVIDPNMPEYKQFNYTCKQNKTYKLQVSHGSNEKFDSEYVLLLLPINPHPTLLSPSRPVYSIIQKNEYQYYVINLTFIQQQSNITIDNDTNILITMIEKNGACVMLTSLTENTPTFDQVFEKNSTVDYSWNGKRQYNVGSDIEAIYVGIKGEKESLYHLQVSISANQQTPESYIKLVGDKVLSYNLSSQLKQDHILLSYAAHSIPYTIIVSPSPACIVYSYSLPFNDTSCRELPQEITQKTIYLKVFRKVDTSKDEGDFKFVVYVYSGSHYLFEYTPIMIACKDACYEYVSVFAPSPIKIVHKGMGYIALKNSQQDYSNEKMDITCEKGYPCFLTINASLPWGGNMELFYDSIDVQEIQWMNKPLTFASSSDPKLFYMQIRSWNSLNTAIFYTQGITVTAYYNIYSMRENATNALEYGFPSSWNYMKKSEGNPLRRFHIVEFDQKLIQELGCNDDNDLCIATLAVYANTLGDYSTQYVNKSIGYYSCNTYEYYTPMNAPYQMSEGYSLTYFSHDLNQGQTTSMASFYFVRVQPLSSCRPQIFAPFSQNSQNVSFSQDMPFYGLYKIDSKTLNQTDPQIEFSISTDTPCEFTLWVLDSDIQPVIENKNYEFTSDSNGLITFVYSDKYLWNNKNFTIAFDKQVNEILIGKYEKYSNGSLKIPTSNSALASAIQTKKLDYNSEQQISTLYIIKASTNATTKLNMKISTHEGFTTIMNNEVEKLTFSQDIYELTYRYFSNSDFLLFVTTDMGTVRVTVTDYKRDDDRNVVVATINENSQPWIKVNAQKNDIREYVITLENVLLMNGNSGRNLQSSDTKYPKVSIHIEQTGTIGLPQLFDGVALFDAFYSDDAQNCYKYISEPIVGRPSLSVSLIFESEMINNVGDVKSRVTIEESDSRLNFTSKQLPTGYRIETSYSSDQVYSICFAINEQSALVGKQFYVMVENLEYSLKHLTLDVPVSQVNPGSYQIYQYVATEDQNLMIEVVNCFGKPTLLGAQKYEDIYLGQVSELGSFYRDNTLSVASKQIKMGYFYFALKLDQASDRYKIRVQLMKENETLHYDKFQLKQKTITKAKSVEENGKQKVRVNLPPISMNNLPNDVKVHHITYNLLVDNLKGGQEYSSNIIAKCPVLGNRNLSSYKFVQNVAQGSIKINTLTEDDIRLDIPSAQIPENFNLTGYVQVSISEPYTQTLTFYYESSTFKLKKTYVTSTAGVSMFTILFIIMLILGTVIVVYILYRRWRTKQKDTRVAFEMANYNYDTTGQSNVTEKQVEKSVVSNNESPSRTLKKALNQNVGYGEFIDESL